MTTTVAEKNKERILEAIDQLRHRKARPDIQRICGYLFRKFGTNSAESKADLQLCVENKIVRRVEYKGSTSYRNALKKNYIPSTRKQKRERNNSTTTIFDNFQNNKVHHHTKFSELLMNVLGELVLIEPDYLEFGVPASKIISSILAKDSARYTEKYISILLDREVDNGGVVKMQCGNYQLGPQPSTESKKPSQHWQHRDNVSGSENEPNVTGEQSDVLSERRQHESYIIQLKPRKRPGPKPGFKKERLENNMDSDEKKSDNGNLRVGGRRKRAKKVFDPSDSHVPKKRGRPAGSLNKATIEKQLARLSDEYRPDSRTSNTSGRDHGGVCSVCHLQNKKGPNERLIACRECSNKAHLSCLNNGDDMMLKMYPDNTWQCPHCKTCVICYETSDAGYLIVCSVCADGYHVNCHKPKLSEKMRNIHQWLCLNCQTPDELKINEIQSNIGNSFPSKTSLCDDNENSSGSNSFASTSSQSATPSPTPPHLSPQMILPESQGASDTQSNRDSENENKDDDDPNIDPNIPDATHWTAEEVYQYFVQFFPEEAKVFKEQEIDGRSLLLLTRVDVLEHLKLRLGPALKIYRHVTMLQTRRDDPRLYWM